MNEQKYIYNYLTNLSVRSLQLIILPKETFAKVCTLLRKNIKRCKLAREELHYKHQ